MTLTPVTVLASHPGVGEEGVCHSQQVTSGRKDGIVAAVSGVILFQNTSLSPPHFSQHFLLCLVKQNRSIWTLNSGEHLIFGMSFPIRALPNSPSGFIGEGRKQRCSFSF